MRIGRLGQLDSSSCRAFSTNSSAFPVALVFNISYRQSTPKRWHLGRHVFSGGRKKSTTSRGKKNGVQARKLLSPSSLLTRIAVALFRLCPFFVFDKLGCIRLLLDTARAHLAQTAWRTTFTPPPPFFLSFLGLAWALSEFDFSTFSLQGEPLADAQGFAMVSCRNGRTPPLQLH